MFFQESLLRGHRQVLEEDLPAAYAELQKLSKEKTKNKREDKKRGAEKKSENEEDQHHHHHHEEEEEEKMAREENTSDSLFPSPSIYPSVYLALLSSCQA